MRREALSNEVPLTGAHCVAKLIKADVIDRYTVRTKAHAQEAMRASDIDEPPRGSPVANMLEALPLEEREYDSHEDNMLDWCGKSADIFHEIQERYSFVGGAYEEYVSYFGRDDLPDYVWSRTSVEGVNAAAGFSVVPKKNGVDQRKLLV